MAEHLLTEVMPYDWRANTGYAVEIEYRCNAGTLEYRYKDSPIGDASYAFLGSMMAGNVAARTDAEAETNGPDDADAPGDFYPLAEFNRQLDLKILDDCFVILRTSDEDEIYWSLAGDAITTKQPREEFYFQLRYIYEGKAYTKDTFPRNKQCKQVVFGAKYDRNNTYIQLHAFNLNVILVNCENRIENVHIDPDIRNPGDGMQLIAPESPDVASRK